MLHHLAFFGSDHRVLKVVTSLDNVSAPVISKKQFQFENIWLENEEFFRTVQNSWLNSFTHNDSAFSSFLAKQESCISSLKSWNVSTHNLFKNKITALNKTITDLQNTLPLEESNVAKIKVLQSQLDAFLYKEEVYWRQRARVSWLNVGDKKTKFFHCFASYRKKTNTIHFLKTENEISFLINGTVHGSIKPTRGLRQGDPLSPYLFILCAEGLSSLLRAYQDRNRLKGISISRRAPSLTHLFFADDSLIFCAASRDSCVALRDIFDIYTKASGQAINFHKSSILFSPNVSVQIKDLFLTNLNLQDIPFISKYLGLPQCLSRSKHHSFSFLKDIVSSVLHSWHSKCFSKAGKEILLKVIIQAIPAYAMACFQLPVKLCKEIEGVIARFWWGSSRDSRKIHWKNWQSLCRSKFVGGLGFRSLIHFNQAMLAKQAWRIFTQPDSLLSLTLKARYFPHSSILAAKVGHNPSFSWRSILWGRDLLVFGLVWKVGDGETINTFTDHWIPNSKFRQPLCDLDYQQLKLSYFIDQSGSWNLDRLNSCFDASSVNDILRVPFSGLDGKDEQIWGRDNSGLFTVKSAYHLALETQDIPSTSSFQDMKPFWAKIWHANVPPKVKHFVWRIVTNSVPVAVLLFQRHIIPSHLCPLCKNYPEIVMHGLLECPRARKAWKASDFAHFYLHNKHLDIMHFITNVFTDAAIDGEKQVYSLSAVVKNDSDQVVARLIKPVTGLVAPVVAEAKAVSLVAMQNKMATLWQPGRGLYVKELYLNLYLFQFYHEVDIERVVEGSPWTFDRARLIFERVKPGTNPRLVPLTRVWRDYLRIQVKIPANMPLKKKKKLEIQGHSERYCEKLFDTSKDQIVKNYSLEIKAAPRQRNCADGSRWLRSGLVTKQRSSSQSFAVNFVSAPSVTPSVTVVAGGSSQVEKNMGSCIMGCNQGRADYVIDNNQNQSPDMRDDFFGKINMKSVEGESNIGLSFLEVKKRRMGRESDSGLGINVDSNDKNSTFLKNMEIMENEYVVNGETSEARVESLARLLKFEGVFVVEALGPAGGLALLWKNKEEGTLLGYSNNHIDIVVSSPHARNWRLIGLYGEPDRNRRQQTWNLLSTLSNQSELPWCVIGDVNNIVRQEDKRGGRRYLQWLLTGFNSTLRQCNLTDLELHGHPFTWEKGCGSNHWVETAGASCSEVVDCVEPIVPDYVNLELCQPITDEEVKKVLFQMHPDKSLGLDEMTPAFYQKCWNIVGGDVINCVRKFFDAMLRKLGFASYWVQLILSCVSSASYNVIHGTHEIGHIVQTRGIRHGDPLSPYLFILCAEGLMALLRKYENRGWLHSCKVANGAPRISHILFADDSYLYCKATYEEALRIKEVLQKFELASGQKVNFANSSIFFSANSGEDIRDNLAALLGMNIALEGSLYLGLPSSMGLNKTAALGYLKEKLRKRLQAWGIRWISWKRLCGHKDKGGMGFRNSRDFNLALLGKQGWRPLINPDSLVARVFKARYFPHVSFLNATIGSNPSFVWRSILEAQFLVKRGSRWVVGDVDGSGWEEDILDNLLLPRDRELVRSVAVHSRPSNDALCCSLELSGLYTVKSAYKLLEQLNGEFDLDVSAKDRFWRK
uniref:Reverse transcriptase domain-containing protein n=1 Tax=Cannabis sativa TaxID=3483 RepID=A0A803NWD5_CANSA